MNVVKTDVDCKKVTDLYVVHC